MRSYISAANATLLILVSLLAVPSARAQTRWPSDAERNQVPLASAAHAPLCQAKTPTLTNRSIGPVRPGQSLQELEKTCPKLQYAWHWNEGLPTPVTLVRFGKASLMIEFSGTTTSSMIYRITTADAQVRTADGFGPGSPLSAIIRAWGKPSFALGECVLAVWFASRPGLSFKVELPDNWDCLASGRVEQTGDVSLLPLGTRVGMALLFARN